MEHDRRPELLGDVPVVHPDEFVRRTGLTRADLEELLGLGLVKGGYSADDLLLAVFLDEVPSTEQFEKLGMTPRADYLSNLKAAAVEVMDDAAPRGAGAGESKGTMGWP